MNDKTMVESSAGAMRDATFADVLSMERRCILEQRKKRKAISHDPEHIVGLALSGGGIRSASFAIGVLQAFHNAGKLKWVDYLSTVSGGGYAGASLTWFNYLSRTMLDSASFPFGEPGYAVRAGAMQSAKTPGGEQLSFVRQHSSYLTPSPQLDIFALIGVVLRNALVSASVYLSLGVLLFIGLIYAGPIAALRLAQYEFLKDIVSSAPGPLWPTILLAALFALLSVVYGVLTFVYPKLMPAASTLYWLRVVAQRIFGIILKLTILALVIGSLPLLTSSFGAWRTALPHAVSALLGTTGLVGTVGAVFQFYRQIRPTLSKRPWVASLRIAVSGLSLIYAVVLASYLIANAIYADKTHLVPWIIALLAFVVLAGLFINLNFFGIGRMYRDRIMETFMADPASVASGAWGYARRADATFLTALGGPEDVGPYHLINCNVVLCDTMQAKFRNRGGDSFVLSHGYCGADSVGWVPTSQFGDGTMSLATATAASGAAVNPYAAVGGKGATRGPLVSFMLAFFGVRLGYWIPNPRRLRSHPLLRRLLWPSLLLPGIRQGLFGSGFQTNAHFLELTDGGHFDNTGIYELARRGCRTIVLSLASADPEQSLADLANAIERIRVDFGIYVYFANMLDELHPNPAGPTTPAIESNLLLSEKGYAVGTIEYPHMPAGKIIVIKSSLVSRLPIDTIVYANGNAAFPNESTANQFFTEDQFEAYRESGYHIAKRMLRDTTVGFPL